MNDREKIESVVQIYIDSMNESNPNKVREAFHVNGMIVGYLRDNFMEMSVDDFARTVESQNPSPKEHGKEVAFEILSLEIEGRTAIVKVRDRYLGKTFVDSLNFIKEADDWEIYNKLFSVEEE